MKKADIEARMADYLEGDLPLEDRALFDAFLDSHPDAAREVEELRRTIDWVRSMPDPEPPADFGARVMDRIRAGEARPGWFERLTRAVSDQLSPQWVVPLTAVTALLVLAVVSGDLRIGALVPDPASDRPVAPSARDAAPERARSGVPSPVSPTELASRSERPLAQPRSRDVVSEAEAARRVARAPLPAPRPGVLAEPASRMPRPPVQRAPLVAVSNPVEPTPPMGIFDFPTPFGAPGVVLGTAATPMGATAFEDPLPETVVEQRRNAQLDPLLEDLYARPDRLARFLLSRRDGELENWGKELARRAAERGEIEQARAAIAANPALDVGPFVAAFTEQADTLRTDVLARESARDTGTGAPGAGDPAP